MSELAPSSSTNGRRNKYKKELDGETSRRRHLYKNFSMLVVSVDLGTAPITASFFSPSLKIITVGMLRIPYLVAIAGLSSVFTL